MITPVLAEAFTHASAVSSAAAGGALPARSSWPLVAVLAVVFVAVFVIAILAIGSLRQSDRKRLIGQIERYGPRHVTPAPSREGREGKVGRTATELVTQLLQTSNTERGLAARLELAAIARKPGEWAVLTASGCVALGAVLALATGNVLISLVAGAVVGWLGARFFVSVRISRRRSAFARQLPDVLQLVASSLQSGFSLPQALDAVVREGTQPSAGEFARALGESRVGVDVEVALDGVANRMDSTDLRWTVIAIRIQREVGGNLAEVLRNTVATMRERTYIRRQVKTLSAEGRLSAYILTALPVLVSGWMLFTARPYMRPLYTTGIGWIMIAGAVTLFTLGVFWLLQVVKVEV